MHERGGARESPKRGRSYFENINLKIYESEQAKNLPLKDFMLNHVTSFEPAVFLELVNDWPALTKWNIEEASVGDANLGQAFGEELV